MASHDELVGKFTKKLRKALDALKDMKAKLEAQRNASKEQTTRIEELQQQVRGVQGERDEALAAA